MLKGDFTHESALLVGGQDGGKSVIVAMFSSRHKSLLLRAGSTLCCRFCRVVEQKNNVGGGVFGEGIVRPRMDFVPPSTWHMMHALRSSFASSSSSSSNDLYRGDGRDASETKEKKKKKTIRVVFVEKTGEEIAVDATVGESVMEAAHQNDVELEGTRNESFVRRVAVSSFAFETTTTFDNNSTHIYNSRLCFLLFSLATTTTTIHATQARAKGLSRARRVTSSSRTRRCSINFPRRATTKMTCSI